MTINEIESTLHTLEQRHPKLSEDTLLTLLRGSGWEEKVIQEALVIFKTTRALGDGHSSLVIEAPKNVKSAPTPPTVTPKEEKISLETKKDMVYYDGSGAEEKKVEVFPDSGKEIPVIKDKVDLSYKEVKTNNQIEVVKQKSSEPQSLVVPAPSHKVPATTVEPPGNLPLKPFESSNHVWPLSRYNDVFHGEVPPILSRAESKLVEEHKDEHKEEHPHKVIKLKRTGFDGEDEGLIVLTGVSLFVVLLLLAYMYSNGRL